MRLSQEWGMSYVCLFAGPRELVDSGVLGAGIQSLVKLENAGSPRPGSRCSGKGSRQNTRVGVDDWLKMAVEGEQWATGRNAGLRQTFPLESK